MLSVKLRLTNSSHRNETFHERKLRTSRTVRAHGNNIEREAPKTGA